MVNLSFSVIIPVYNAENTLVRCINSFLTQDYGSYELLLVDDHSTDASASMCKQFALDYPCVKYLEAVGKGVSAARNTGLKNATGEIISFCDSDDFVDADMFKTVAEQFTGNEDIDVIVSGIIRTRINDGVAEVVSDTRLPEAAWSGSAFAKRLICNGNVMGSVCNKYYRREVLKGCLFREDLSYCEDTYFNMLIVGENPNLKVKTANKNFYHYCLNPSSATAVGDKSADKLFSEDGKLKYIEAMDAILEDIELAPQIRSVVQRAKFTLATDTLWTFTCNERQECELINVMKANVRSYFKNINIAHPRGECGRLIRALTLLCRHKQLRV